MPDWTRRSQTCREGGKEREGGGRGRGEGRRGEGEGGGRGRGEKRRERTVRYDVPDTSILRA